MDVPEFQVARGESVFLVGQSGSGKSTLLSLICGIAAPTSGSIRVAGQSMTEAKPSKRDRIRADSIGIIFQMFNLLPYATALDNILVPLRFSRRRRERAVAAREAALELTDALGLSRDLVEKTRASDLSVGQQQRVAVARAMIGTPDIIVADEPTSALDDGAQAEFLDLLFDQVRRFDMTLLMVSHDGRNASRFDRRIEMGAIALADRHSGP